MKHVKTFESFQVNEELSIKGLFPILTSLFLTLKPFDASAIVLGGAKGGKRYAATSTMEIRNIASKIQTDLEKLKSETQDPKVLELIESIQSLRNWKYSDGFDKVAVVTDSLYSYIQSQNINDPLINDTLKNLSKGDIELIKSDYDMLLNKYEEMKNKETSGEILLVILLILCISALVFFGMEMRGSGF